MYLVRHHHLSGFFLERAMRLNIRHINFQELIWESELKSLTKLVALFLSRCANGDADIAWPSHKRIALETGMSERSVRNQLDILESSGWIVRDRGGLSVGGKQHVSKYILNLPDAIQKQIPTAGGAAGMPVPTARGAVAPTARGADHRGGYKGKNYISLSPVEKTLSSVEENLPQRNHRHLAYISSLLTTYGEKGVKEIRSIGARRFAGSWLSCVDSFDEQIIQMAIFKHLEDKPGYFPTVAEIRANCVHYTESEKPKASPKRKTFKKPSLEDVFSYCKERNNQVNAEQFIDHYESNGWRVGKNPMKNWKAAVRTWERSSTGANANGKNREIGRKLSASEIGAENARRFEEQCRRDKEALHGEIVAADG